MKTKLHTPTHPALMAWTEAADAKAWANYYCRIVPPTVAQSMLFVRMADRMFSGWIRQAMFVQPLKLP